MSNDIQIGSLVKIIDLCSDVSYLQRYKQSLNKVGIVNAIYDCSFHVIIGGDTLTYLPTELEIISSKKNNVFIL